MRKDSVLILRTCSADGTSYGGFQWPLEAGAKVEAQDWNSEPVCGGGLHGLPWGIGDHTLMDLGPTARGIVFEAPVKGVVDIDGAKCKVQRGTVRFVGTLDEATAWINERSAPNAKGYLGTATAGESGTATAGYRGTATAGYRGTATAGDRGTATAGYLGTATAGYRGTATAGYLGTATAGYLGTATAGDRGTATAGYLGTATAGYLGTATAGYRGTATAGESGVVAIQYWNGKRYKVRVATVKDADGDGELEPNTQYRLDDAGNWVVAK